MSTFFYPNIKLTLKDILIITSGKISNNFTDININNVASLENANVGDISFFNNKTYIEDFKSTKASACFINEKYEKDCPFTTIPIVVENPYKAFALICQKLYPMFDVKPYISKHSIIDPSAKIDSTSYIGDFTHIGKNVFIGKNTYIGNNITIYDNVTIGDNCYIYSNCSIKYSEIGNNCIIHDGVKIGQDGFGFAPNIGGHIKIPQIGSVKIYNNVEIGSNSTIDRGALNNTIIGEGTKIDNLVQIAHNVQIGKHCFLAAQVGIAGSTILEDYVFVGGGSGIAPHLKINEGAQIAPMSGVSRNIDKNETVIGVPAITFQSFWKLQALFKKMLNKKNNIGEER